MSVAIYTRSSLDCPLTADEQVERLRTIAENRGWIVKQVFLDEPTSIRKGVDRRPGEVALLRAIQSGVIDRALVWSIDRIGRSLAELISFLEVCRTAGVAVIVHEQRINTEQSDALLQTSVLMALHLRQSRRERVLRGQAAARAASVKFGRPPIAKIKVDKVRQELAAGKGVRQVAQTTGVSPASVSRLKVTLDLMPA